MSFSGPMMALDQSQAEKHDFQQLDIKLKTVGS